MSEEYTTEHSVKCSVMSRKGLEREVDDGLTTWQSFRSVYAQANPGRSAKEAGEAWAVYKEEGRNVGKKAAPKAKKSSPKKAVAKAKSKVGLPPPKHLGKPPSPPVERKVSQKRTPPNKPLPPVPRKGPSAHLQSASLTGVPIDVLRAHVAPHLSRRDVVALRKTAHIGSRITDQQMKLICREPPNQREILDYIREWMATHKNGSLRVWAMNKLAKWAVVVRVSVEKKKWQLRVLDYQPGNYDPEYSHVLTDAKPAAILKRLSIYRSISVPILEDGEKEGKGLIEPLTEILKKRGSCAGMKPTPEFIELCILPLVRTILADYPNTKSMNKMRKMSVNALANGEWKVEPEDVDQDEDEPEEEDRKAEVFLAVRDLVYFGEHFIRFGTYPLLNLRYDLDHRNVTLEDAVRWIFADIKDKIEGKDEHEPEEEEEGEDE